MPTTFNLCDAKTRLSELVERAAEGEEIVIAKAGKPRARLVALPSARKPRRPGCWSGKVRIAENFDAPLPENIMRVFQGQSRNGDG